MALIIFDYDGVIMDSKASWAHAFKKTAEEYEFDYTFDEIVKHFGPKTIDVLRDLFDGDEEKVQETKKFIDNVLQKEETLVLSNPSPEISKAANSLKERGHTLAILTNGDRAFLEASMDYHSLDKSVYSERIAAEREYETKKETINHLIEKHGASKDETYYIGDKIRDAEIAGEVGCKSIILVRYGWDPEEKLREAKPDHIIYCLKDILDIIA